MCLRRERSGFGFLCVLLAQQDFWCLGRDQVTEESIAAGSSTKLWFPHCPRFSSTHQTEQASSLFPLNIRHRIESGQRPHAHSAQRRFHRTCLRVHHIGISSRPAMDRDKNSADNLQGASRCCLNSQHGHTRHRPPEAHSHPIHALVLIALLMPALLPHLYPPRNEFLTNPAS